MVEPVSMWKCFCAFAQIEPEQPQDVRDTAPMPLALGGLGLRSAAQGSKPAYWASWADCVPMIRQRHSRVAERLVAELGGEPVTPLLKAASQCGVQFTGRMRFDPPSWEALARGARPLAREPEDREPGTIRRG